MRQDEPAGISDSLLNPLAIYILGMVLIPWAAAPLLRIIVSGAAAGLPQAAADALVTGGVLVVQGLAIIALTLSHGLGPRGLGLPPHALGISRRDLSGGVRLGLAGGLLLMVINLAGSRAAITLFRLLLGDEAVAGRLARERGVVTELFQLELPGPVLLLLFLGSVVIAPVAEELFFRGYLHNVLRARLGARAAYASAALFAAAHMYVIHFLPLFLMGVVMARLYERQGTLIAPVVAHALANFIVAASLVTLRSLSLS